MRIPKQFLFLLPILTGVIVVHLRISPMSKVTVVKSELKCFLLYSQYVITTNHIVCAHIGSHA